MGKLMVGDKAPDFTLKNKDDEERKLSDFKGKWVVLYFYPRDNTKGCTQEAKDFTKHLPDFTQNNAVVIGISPDTTKSHVKFTERHDIDVELLSDTTCEVSDRYGVWQLKKLAGREYMGIVRTTFLINPDGIIEEIWEKVKVKNHVETVKSALKARLG